MIRTSVDVQVGSGSPGTKRDVVAGEKFAIGILVEVAPGRQEAVRFDTILIDVVFNSGKSARIHIDPDERPVAAELAATGKGVVDALTGEALKAGSLSDDPPLSKGSTMAMAGVDKAAAAIGGYQSRTGLAGYVSKTPFELKLRGRAQAFAYGMVEAQLDGEDPDETSIWATGYALLGDVPVGIAPVRSIVRITKG